MARARVVNIKEPVELYEVDAADAEERRTFFAESQAAPTVLESGDFSHAARAAGTLLAEHAGDGTLLLILRGPPTPW